MNEFSVISTRNFNDPRMIGPDLDGDGVAKVLDSNGDVAFDRVINLSCTAPHFYCH